MNNPCVRGVGAIALTVALTIGACSSDDPTTNGSVVLDADAEPTTSLEQPTDAATLTAALDTIVADTGVPAVGAAFFDANGVIEIAVSGVRERGGTTEATTDDLFHLGSNTKAMTAAVLARLTDQGRGVSFDTTLAEAFPTLTTIDEGYASVTLHHC